MRLRFHVDTNQTKIHSNSQWVQFIESLIKPVISGMPLNEPVAQQTEFIDSFSDEYGNRRATDRPFISTLFGISQSPTVESSDALDEQLWWLINSNKLTKEHALDLIEPTGPLVSDSEKLAIEYRTMVELSALHALWNFAQEIASPDLINRCINAAHWHIKELQPDNGINRPWAAHVFIYLASTTLDHEMSSLANLHAQTLIHNTSVTLGQPDRLSALILKDISNQLQKYQAS